MSSILLLLLLRGWLLLVDAEFWRWTLNAMLDLVDGLDKCEEGLDRRIEIETV